MNKPTFDAMVAQYKKPTIEGEGAVSWDKGVRCVIPEVQISGKVVQDGTPTPDAPVMPVFSEETTVVSRGKNLANAFIASTQYLAKSSKIAENVFRVTRNSETLFGGYGQVKIEGLPNDCPLRLVCAYTKESVVQEGHPAKVHVWQEANSVGGTSRIIYFGESGTERTDSFVAHNGYIYCGLYPNTAENGGSATFQLSVYVDEQVSLEYEPYFDGGTATAPELLAIPGTDVRDTWDPQTGMGVRRVGKLVLDGTENWTDSGYSTASFNAFYPRDFQLPAVPNTRPHPCMCTHLPMKPNYLLDELGVVCSIYNRQIYIFLPKEDFPDVAAVEEWLAEQYAAGTPVTIWYALLEPVPFETDPAPLIQPPGTGHIIQTGGTLDGVPIIATPVTHS